MKCHVPNTLGGTSVSAAAGRGPTIFNFFLGSRIRRLLLILSVLDTLCTRVGITQGHNQGKGHQSGLYLSHLSISSRRHPGNISGGFRVVRVLDTHERVAHVRPELLMKACRCALTTRLNLNTKVHSKYITYDKLRTKNN